MDCDDVCFDDTDGATDCIVVGSNIRDGANVLVGKSVGVDDGDSFRLAKGVTVGD